LSVIIASVQMSAGLAVLGGCLAAIRRIEQPLFELPEWPLKFFPSDDQLREDLDALDAAS
jgi:hypothetical protein